MFGILVSMNRPLISGMGSFEQLQTVISVLDQEGHETLIGDNNCNFSFKHQKVHRN